MNTLTPDRYFSPEMSTRALARELYQAVASLPLICPHGHVDPRLFAEPMRLLVRPLTSSLSQTITLRACCIHKEYRSKPLVFHVSMADLSKVIIARSGNSYARTSISFAIPPSGIWLAETACVCQLAGLVVRHIVDLDDAHEMMQELAVGLAKRAYQLT